MISSLGFWLGSRRGASAAAPGLRNKKPRKKQHGRHPGVYSERSVVVVGTCFRKRVQNANHTNEVFHSPLQGIQSKTAEEANAVLFFILAMLRGSWSSMGSHVLKNASCAFCAADAN